MPRHELVHSAREESADTEWKDPPAAFSRDDSSQAGKGQGEISRGLCHLRIAGIAVSFRCPTVPCLGLIALLLVSLVLRLALTLRGGQGFWPDEVRYTAVVNALSNWEAGHRREALQLLIGTADHIGFKVLMLGPAWLQTQLKAGIWFPSAIISSSSASLLLETIIGP